MSGIEKNLAPQHHHQAGVALINSRTSIDSRRWTQLLDIAASKSASAQLKFLSILSVGNERRAWLVDDVILLAECKQDPLGHQTEIEQIWFPNGRLRDFRKQAVLSSHADTLDIGELISKPNNPVGESLGTCAVTTNGPNRIDVEVEATRPCLLVMNDKFDPGWSATIRRSGGCLFANVEIHEVNGVMRGVVVPAGSSRITIKYLPLSLLLGGGLTAVGWGSILLSVLWSRRGRRTKSDEG